MKYRSITFATTFLALGLFSFCLASRAVVPAPDGGYPGSNTAEGQNALFSRTTGVWNTALGAFALYGDTTGNGNTAVGINGLRNNVTGGFNTAVGLDALYFNNGNPANGEASQTLPLEAMPFFTIPRALTIAPLEQMRSLTTTLATAIALLVPARWRRTSAGP